MKKLIIFFIAILCTSCAVSTKNAPNILDIPHITHETLISKPKSTMILQLYKTFNFDLFKQTYSPGDRKEHKVGDNIYYEAPDKSLYDCYYYKDFGGKSEKSMFKIIPKEKGFEHFKYYYYSSGKLYQTVQFAGRGSDIKIGKSYTYDESGKVIKEEDHDKKFLNITFDKILLYAESKGFINLKTGEGIENVGYEYFEKSKVWKISHMYFEEEGIREEYSYYYIDAKTGKLLETRSQTIYTYPIDVPWYKNKPYKEKYSDVNWENGIFIDTDKEIYKTYEGKSYTFEEWKVFEENQYKLYKEKQNRKGFLGGLFS